MFTGIIRATGRLYRIEPTSAGVRLLIDPGDLGAAVEAWGRLPGPGDSICVSGCCLTLVEPVGTAGEGGARSGLLTFDAIPETLARTTLGGWEPGHKVNLETSVTAATPMDGHVVQGHVEGVGQVIGLETGSEYRVRIAPPVDVPDMLACLVPKGSVTVDGVSLTIAAVDAGEGGGWFEITLIPTTLELTTLGELCVGSRVNLETDVMVRTVVHVLRHVQAAHGVGESGRD